MRLATLCIVMLSLPISGQELARPRPSKSLAPAKRLFKQFVNLTQRQHPQLAKLYADEAEVIEDKIVNKNERKVLRFTGDQYKVYLQAKLRPLPIRAKNTTLKVRQQPKITFSSVAYTGLANGDIKIKGIYYSTKTRKYNTFTIIVAKTSRHRWQILYQVFYSN